MNFIKGKLLTQLSIGLKDNLSQCGMQSLRQLLINLGSSPAHLITHLALQKALPMSFNSACVELKRIIIEIITPIDFILVFPIALLPILSKDLNFVRKGQIL